MYLVNQGNLDQYLANDLTASWLDAHAEAADEELVCHRWLRQSPPKRFIFSNLYGELLTTSQRLRVLDVGGGLTGLTRTLATRHHYVLADLLAHDDSQTAESMMEHVGRRFIHAQDWATLDCEPYDRIIANDIFPNVDQRLELFLQKLLPYTHRMQLSLTYYDAPRFYITRRIDADEVLCMLAWSSEHLSLVLKKYAAKIISADLGVFSSPGESVYANGRQVCVIELRGGLHDEANP